ncbi:MAG: type II toxin-antitoxin system Phd/YefM family antitoxin [Nocardioides sp.]
MTTVPVAEARANLSRMIDEAVSTHQRVEITRNGVRAAVLLGSDDYDGLMETLDVLADADLVRAIGAGRAESARGDVVELDDVAEEMHAAGRLPR